MRGEGKRRTEGGREASKKRGRGRDMGGEGEKRWERIVNKGWKEKGGGRWRETRRKRGMGEGRENKRGGGERKGRLKEGKKEGK